MYTDKSWADAHQHCSEAHPSDGNLASVPDHETEEYLDKIAQHFWTGGLKKPGEEWKWTDETPWNYDNWVGDHPIKRRMYYQRSAGGWKTENGMERKNFICQYPNTP